MNRIIAVISLVAMFAMSAIPAFATGRELSVYSVNLTTYAVTNATWQASQISGDVRIHHIIITNSDAAENQTVTFYSQSDSTTTVTSAFSVDIASTAATGYVEPIQIPFPIAASPLMIHDLCIRKSSLLSDVKVSIFYR